MASTHIILLLALACVPNALSSVEIAKVQNAEEIYLGQLYADMDKGLKNIVRENLKSVLRVFIEKSQELNVSTKCMRNSLRIFSGLRDLKLWAISFIDATGKPSDGMLSGNFHMFGNYDQCLNSSAPKKGGVVDFRGQYCLISAAPYLLKPELMPNSRDRIALVERLTQNLTEPFRLFAFKSEALKAKSDKFGLCVPSGCNNNDVDKLIKYAGKLIMMNLTLDYCDTEDTLTYFTKTRSVVLCIYSFFILLVLCGSAIDQYSKAKQIKIEKNLFSGALTWVRRFFFQIILNGTFSVDVFFFIGGFLNCYVRAKRNVTKFSFSSSFMFFIHRLFRIYPILIFSFLLIFLFKPRGPMGHYLEMKYGGLCYTEWWKNILFINNFYDAENQCAAHTWYLAADMQYFLVSLFTIPLLFSKLLISENEKNKKGFIWQRAFINIAELLGNINPKIGVLVNLAIILSSTVITSVRFAVDNLPPSIMPLPGQSEKSIKSVFKVYNSTLTHASSYFGGILLGFFIAKKRNLTFSKILQFFGWIAASAMLCTLLFVTKKWNSGYPWTKLGGVLYASLSRPLYSCCVGWLISCCVAGHGGVINYILSLKVWIPLNRLCLTAYLLSSVLQMYFNGNLRSPMDVQTEIEIWVYFGDIAVTFLLSLPMVLIFESPFIALEKIIFPTKENTSELKEKEMIGKEMIEISNDTKSDKDRNSNKI